MQRGPAGSCCSKLPRHAAYVLRPHMGPALCLSVWLYVCLSGRSSGVCTCVCVYVSLHSCPPAATERIRLRLGLIVTNTLRPVAITYLAVWPLTLACHRLWNAATACSSGADAAQVMLKNLIRVLPLYGLRFSVTNTPRPVIFH